MSKRWFAGVGFVFLIVFVVFIVGYSSADSPTGYGLFDRFNTNVNARLPTNINIVQDVVVIQTSLCGNGRLDEGEMCDDRNIRDGDRCSSDCLRCTLPKGTSSIRRLGCPNICGDGVVVAGEECDDGNNADSDGCNSNCRRPRTFTIWTNVGLTVCGDGVEEGGEECDDGNFIPNDGCDACLRNPLTCYACGEFGCGDFSVDGDNCGVFFSDALCSNSCGPLVVEVPPNDDDREGCAEPNPFDLPPGTRFRDYEDARHISTCESEDSARYVICSDDGEITVNVADCTPGVLCEDGACIDDPRWRSECFDSDGGVNSDIAGEVIIFRDDGSERHHRDSCTFNDDGVVEQFCIDGETRRTTTVDCPGDQHCEDGLCILGAPPPLPVWTCEDSDGGENAFEFGVVVVYRDGVRHDEASDSCTFDQRVRERFCSAGSNSYTYLLCPPDQHCEGGVCVSGEPLEITCEDSDGQDRYVRGRLTFTRADGEISHSGWDSCSTIAGRDHVSERVCSPDGRTEDHINLPCLFPEHCEAGACVPGAGSCSRTAATDDTPGIVTGRDGIEQPDVCEGDVLHVFQCDAGTGMPAVAENIVCERGCENGLCL